MRFCLSNCGHLMSYVGPHSFFDLNLNSKRAGQNEGECSILKANEGRVNNIGVYRGLRLLLKQHSKAKALFLNLRSSLFYLFLLPAVLGNMAKASENIVFYLEDEPIYTSSSKQSPGFLMETVLEMSKIMGVKPEIKFLPWKRAQRMAISTPNAIIFPLTRSASRESKYRWVCKIFDVPVMFINKQGQPVINTAEQAKGVRGIGVILGTPQEEYLNALGLLYVPLSGKQLYSSLANNSVKTVYSAKPEAMLAWKKGRYEQTLQFGQTLQTLPLWIAASKNSDQIDIDQWGKALEQVKASGYFDTMLTKYFGKQRSTQ